MHRIRSLSVSLTILIVAGFGVAAVTSFAGLGLYWGFQERRALVDDTSLTTLATRIGGLTHELQKERGASAGFLASKGQNFVDALPKQRALSDGQIKTVRTALEGLQRDEAAPARLKGMARDVLSRIDALPDLRRQIDSQSVDLPTAVGTITALNRAAIGLLPEIGKSVSQPDAARAVQRHAIFMTAKDIVGLERATGAAGLARARAGDQTLPPAMKARFMNLVKQQETLLGIYRSIASDKMQERLKALETAKPTVLVRRMREDIISDDPARISALTPEDWFQTITGMINLVKATEDAGADEIVGHMSAALGDVDGNLRRELVKAVLFISGLLLISLFVTRTAGRSLRATASRVAALAEGDVDSEVVQAPQSDLAQITSALEKFRLNELEARNQAEVQRKLEAKSADGIRRISSEVGDGNFSARLRLRDLSGASQILGQGINEILDVAERLATEQQEQDRAALRQQEEEVATQRKTVAALNELVRSCTAGDFSQRVDTSELSGVWREVSEGLNQIASMTGSALSDIRRIMMALAEGDLSARMSDDYKGTFAEIGEATNTSLDLLKDAFLSIDQGVKSIGESAHELRSGTRDLTQRSGDQATTVVESAAATQELSATVSENGKKLVECRELTKALEQKTKEGQDVAGVAVASMATIESASSEMGKIVATIDEIAFQTNLLALNASVEAARAGDAGKGFAVVASEVRALAGRCADASKQIGALISESVQGVNEGANSVRQTGEAIQEMEETLGSVKRVIEEVTAAGTEQTKGVEVLHDGMSRLEHMAQSNVSLARQNSGLMERLTDLEAHLAGTVSGFLKDNTGLDQPKAKAPDGLVSRAS